MRLKTMLEFGLASTALLLLSVESGWAGAGGPCGTGGPHGVPEPASLALLAVGVGGILLYRSRSRGNKK